MPERTKKSEKPLKLGKVHLVGAGPGEPDLLTLRGQKLLETADVVLYDYLANAQLMQHCSPLAEKICLGSHAAGRVWSQQEINSAMIEKARAGKKVVRLKGGDPLIFGCGFQELEALELANIPFEVVPGISAGIAAAAYAGIPITHRDSASAVAFVTGQERLGKQNSIHELPALAKFPGTLIIYMGTTTVELWSGGLIQYGKSSDTPVAVVRRCTHANQSITLTTLGQVANLVRTDPPMRPPVVFIVGEVASFSSRFNWFSRQQLTGKTILVTRSEGQSETLTSPLRELGAEVVCDPAIEIVPLNEGDSIKNTIGHESSFDWLIFLSTNGVREFMRHLGQEGQDVRWFAQSRLAAIGPGTAAELQRYHLTTDLQPNDYNSEGLLKAFEDEASAQSFLIVRAKQGREILSEGLSRAGGNVTELAVYESVPRKQLSESTMERMQCGSIDWVTITSSAIARSLHNSLGEALRDVKLASISPVTSNTLRTLGYSVAAEANEATMPALVEAMTQVETTSDDASLNDPESPNC